MPIDIDKLDVVDGTHTKTPPTLFAHSEQRLILPIYSSFICSLMLASSVLKRGNDKKYSGWVLKSTDGDLPTARYFRE